MILISTSINGKAEEERTVYL